MGLVLPPPSATEQTPLLTEQIRKATASVAGLAAYLISLGGKTLPDAQVSTPGRVKDLILNLAYPRGPEGDIKVVYNGVKPSDFKAAEDRIGGRGPSRPR